MEESNTKFIIKHPRENSQSFTFLFVFILISAVNLGILIFPPESHGQASDVINQNLINSSIPGIDVTVQRIFDFLTGSACRFIQFAIVAISIMMIFYGIMFLMSRGTPQGMTAGKKALTWGIVGGVVIFGVFTIVLSLAALIGVSYPITQMITC